MLQLGGDKTLTQGARKAGLDVVIKNELHLPFEKTLIVEPGTCVPWDLLPAALHFLDKWDAAVPLWRYGMTAADVGTDEDRAATKAVVRDLRVLMHSVELLFIRRNEAGIALLEAWKQELAGGGDKRLAFLRAVYQVKPRLCALPTTWLADVRAHSKQAVRSRRPAPVTVGQPLVRIELEPGRFVKVRAGDEEKAREHFRRQRAASRG